jgi:hypothetical protein
MMAAQIHDEDEEAEIERAYDKEVGQVRDKAATVRLLTREDHGTVYALFDEILALHHQRLLMDPTTRKMGPGGEAPSFRVAMRNNLHGDKGTGRVPRIVVVLCKEADWQEHSCELRFELNEQVWDAVTDAHRRFVVDEGWETVRPDLDRQGRQRLDENGRRVLLKGKPDVVCHSAVVERQGAAFVEIARVVAAAAASQVEHQLAFDFRGATRPAPPAAPEPEPEAPLDPEVVRQEEFEKARARKRALATV